MDPQTVTRPAPAGAGLFSSPDSRELTTSAMDPRHLLGLEGMARHDLLEILESADRYRQALDRRERIAELPVNTSVANCFFEDSTRTRFSFEIAEQHLGLRHVTFTSSGSSMSKGESLRDTMRVITSMAVDLVVVRHSSPGAPHFLAREIEAGVINAGDGAHEHPTQGLLDLLTLRRAWEGRFEERTIAIVGDIAHSRVARSAIHGLRTLGARVVVAGPPTLIPEGIESMGVSLTATVEEALEGADAAMTLRLQRERMEKGLLSTPGEYARIWGLDASRVERLKPGAPILHPGPVNRGVEIAADVADGPRSVILEQVTNGVAVRCAVLERCARAVERSRPWAS